MNIDIVDKNKNICLDCNKNFSSKQSLKVHTKTSKCMLKKDKKLLCEYCEKSFSSKQMINYHYDICVYKKILLLNEGHQKNVENLKNRYEEEIYELNEKIKELEIALKSNK